MSKNTKKRSDAIQQMAMTMVYDAGPAWITMMAIRVQLLDNLIKC